MNSILKTTVLIIGLIILLGLIMAMWLAPSPWLCLLVTASGFFWCIWLYWVAKLNDYSRKPALAGMILNGLACAAIAFAMAAGID